MSQNNLNELHDRYRQLKPEAQEINHRDGLVEFKLTQKDGWLLDENTLELEISWGSIERNDPRIKQSQDWLEVYEKIKIAQFDDAAKKIIRKTILGIE